MIEIALYQPDIAPNTATIARLCACFGLKLTIIEPAGFAFSDSAFRRAGMDYLNQVDLVRSPSWAAFHAANSRRRMVLLTTKATQNHVSFQFEANDILVLGRESAGVPDSVHDALPHRLRIPMRPQTRSLNVDLAAGMVAGEALRQLEQFPTVPVDAKVPIANLGEP
jgi:tRNA (cytidine/uridine-2'-O-)-methyltransferase